MKIKILKDNYENLVFLLLYFTLFVGFFTYNFNVPNSVLYIGDFLNIMLVFLCLNKLKYILYNKTLKIFACFIILFICIGYIVASMYNLNLFLYVWSLRNWGRGISFFICCALVVKKINADRFINSFFKIYQINVILIVIQSLFFKNLYTIDSLNGLFGRNTSGVNMLASMIFLVIVLSKYVSKKISAIKLMIYLLEISLVGIIAELRAIFVFEIVFVIIFITINMKLSNKNIIKYFTFCSIFFFISLIVIKQISNISPEFSDLLSIKTIIDGMNNEYGYGFSGYIDRLNFITVINKYFFSTNILKLFGIGLGNAEYSSISFLCSDFYKQYGETYKYLNFSSSMLYVETGLIGLVCFLSAFITILINCFNIVRKSIKINFHDNQFYANVGFGSVIIVLIFIFYNNLQRTDIVYVLSFFVAMPYMKDVIKNNTNKGGV